MGDVLQGGPGRSGPSRRVWLAVGLAALVALGAYAATRRGHTGGTGDGRSPATATAPAASGSPAPSRSVWPSGEGACGTTAYRPLMSPQPLTERIGVRLLVGGHGLRLVDADTGRGQPVGGIPVDAQHVVSQLVRAGGAVYALSARCDGVAEGRVYRVRNGAAQPLAGAPVDNLLAGPNRVWAMTYPDQGAAPNAAVVLRRLDGGRSIALPLNAFNSLVADTSAGLLVAESEANPEALPPRVSVLDPTTGRRVRSLGVGRPLGTDGTQLLLLLGPCWEGQATPSCTVARIDVRTGAVLGRVALPRGRVPVSVGYFSRNGRLVAFQLARARPDPQFDPGHPIPPSDVVVLHLDTGRLDIVPGLELAPKTAAGLVFAGTGDWLFATVSDGDHAHLLAWHPGVPGPQSVARLVGPVAGAPPLLVD